MFISFTRAIALLTTALGASGAGLHALPDFIRPDPFGGIVHADRNASDPRMKSATLRAARRSFVSVHAVVTSAEPGEYSIDVQFPLPVDVYREWYHLNKADSAYYPDALVPVTLPHRSRLPDADNRIAKQTAQAFWLDIWVSPETRPGMYRGAVTLTSGGATHSLPVEVNVVGSTVPAEDVVTLDSNSYGTSWLFEQYPNTLSRSDDADLFRLIHAYHRIFYEHRSTFHQLGYGHAGKVGPEFAPVLSGSGRDKQVSSWDKFDRHYGPLLDGSAFRTTRRGAAPVRYVYLPVNPEWPASYLWWGEPGYEVEFVNILSEMERHFREKGWTSTKFELFFNHKKRYKGFSWDGDEIRFEGDNDFLVTYRRLLNKALPQNTPVQFVMRADTSWSMADQFRRLRNVVNFWVAGEGILSWYPGAAKQLRTRGDTIWTYGGTPDVTHVSSEITLNPLRSWVTGVQGFVRWLAVSPGPDPWYSLGGGGETLVYPGDRFGRNEPLASIRLKLQRNCLQDLALLESRAQSGSRDAVLSEVVRRYNGTSPAAWSNDPPELVKRPVLEWNNRNIEEALQPYEARFSTLQPDAWLRVRRYALESAGGEQ